MQFVVFEREERIRQRAGEDEKRIVILHLQPARMRDDDMVLAREPYTFRFTAEEPGGDPQAGDVYELRRVEGGSSEE